MNTMSTPPVIMDSVAHNVSNHCSALSQANQTDSRVNAQLDASSCLFLSMLPHEKVVSALLWITVLLVLFSLLVNGLAFFGLGQSEDFSWMPRAALLKNLTLSDVIQTLVFAPAVIHSLLNRQAMAFGVWCFLQYFVGGIAIFSSLVTITCMALERYLYVCHAIHYLVIVTRLRLRVILSLIWIYSLSVSSISVVLLHTGKKEKADERFVKGLICEPDVVDEYLGFPRSASIFRKVIGPGTLLLCLLVYAFAYARMYQAARNAVVPFNEVNTTARKTVLFYCGMLFIQLLPLLCKVLSDVVVDFVESVFTMPVESQDGVQPKPASLHVALMVMLLVPPCINPLVFVFSNAEMRQLLLRRWTDRRCAETCWITDVV